MRKKVIWAAIASAVFAGAASVFIMACILRPVPLAVSPVKLSAIADGSYIGTCQNKILFAVVRADVRDHRIENIEVLYHKKSYMDQAERTAARIVEKQTPTVDAVSGATLTSDTVKKAVENALLQGIR
jgi:uncharacterized protein with FMN-binding domain